MVQIAISYLYIGRFDFLLRKYVRITGCCLYLDANSNFEKIIVQVSAEKCLLISGGLKKDGPYILYILYICQYLFTSKTFFFNFPICCLFYVHVH